MKHEQGTKRIQISHIRHANLRVKAGVADHGWILRGDLGNEDLLWIGILDLPRQLLQKPPWHIVYAVHAQTVTMIFFYPHTTAFLEVVADFGLLKSKPASPRSVFLTLEVDSATVVPPETIPVPQRIALGRTVVQDNVKKNG